MSSVAEEAAEFQRFEQWSDFTAFMKEPAP